MRFQTKLMLVFVLLLLTVVGSMAFLSYRNAERLLGRVETDLQQVVSSVHFSTRRLSQENGPDREFLEKFVREARAKQGVKEVSVVSNRHEVIASSNPKRVGRREQVLNGKEIVVQEQFGVSDSLKEPGSHRLRYEVRMPLIRDDRVIGLVQTSISLTDFRRLLRDALIKNIIIALAALAVACGASFFILNRLNHPIRTLGITAERVASGDLTARIDGLGNDEMGRLARTFNDMIARLAEQKLMEARSHHLERQAIVAELASTLAHEIRNPLNLINLTADHLADQFPPPEAARREQFRELAGSLKSEVKHLNRVVGDFLELGRPHRVRKERFRLADLIDQVEVMVKQQLATRNIRYRRECQEDLHLQGDLEQIRLVFLNLMLNAIHAVATNGEIAIRAARDGEGSAVVRVSDDGHGVEESQLPHLFEPYFTLRKGGTGLGLALVRRIIEAHEGRIVAIRNPGGGLTMEFTFPPEA